MIKCIKKDPKRIFFAPPNSSRDVQLSWITFTQLVEISSTVKAELSRHPGRNRAELGGGLDGTRTRNFRRDRAVL